MKHTFLKWSLALSLSLGWVGLSAAELEDGPLVDGLKDLKRLNQKLVGMTERCSEATVALFSLGGGGSGSGVVVSEDGLILTAAHVVESLNGEVVVMFPDGTRKNGEILGGEFDRDAAMVRITEEGEYPFVELAEDGTLQRNQWCVALGHPGGFDPTRTPPIRLGRVLAVGNFIESDCAVVGGDSGGPLFDVEGQLIGIHSNIGATLSQNRHVPLSVYREHWDMMLEGKRKGSRFASKPQGDPDRAVMGVQLGDPGPKGGVRVMGVMEGSPAEKAGLKEGDVIMAFAGKKVRDRDGLMAVAGKLDAGKKVRLMYEREGKRRRTELKLVRMAELMGGGASKDEPAEKKRDEPAEKKAESKPDAPKLDLEQLLRQAMKDGGDLKLTREQLEALGGPEEMAKAIREMMEKMGPEELKKLAEQAPSIELQDPFFSSVMSALEPVVSKADRSTVTVLVDGKPVALGTVVSEDGWILTKSEETLEGELDVRLGDESYEAAVVQRFPRRDLVLLSIDAAGLKPVRWVKDEDKLRLGTLLTSPSADGEAMGVGVISVKKRALADIGFLGIRSEKVEDGIRVAEVVAKSSAAKSGIKAGDVIVKLEGESVGDPLEFSNHVRGLRAGDVMELEIERDGDRKSVSVELGSRPEGPTSDRFRRMNEMAGPLSSRSSGYPLVIQHDMPLLPEQCGGPVLNLRGECIGINVSRAGRVKTLAIPSSDILELLEQAESASPEVDEDDLKAVRELIEEVQENLSELQERLEELESR